MSESPSRSVAGEVIEKSAGAARTVAGLTPAQAQTLILFICCMFLCGLVGWQTVNEPRERRERDALQMRTIADVQERATQSCSQEREKDRAFWAGELEKNRAVLGALTRAIEKHNDRP